MPNFVVIRQEVRAVFAVENLLSPEKWTKVHQNHLRSVAHQWCPSVSQISSGSAKRCRVKGGIGTLSTFACKTYNYGSMWVLSTRKAVHRATKSAEKCYQYDAFTFIVLFLLSDRVMHFQNYVHYLLESLRAGCCHRCYSLSMDTLIDSLCRSH